MADIGRPERIIKTVPAPKVPERTPEPVKKPEKEPVPA